MGPDNLLNPGYETREDEIERCKSILNTMHPHLVMGTKQYYDPFALEICKKINICELPDKESS